MNKIIVILLIILVMMIAAILGGIIVTTYIENSQEKIDIAKLEEVSFEEEIGKIEEIVDVSSIEEKISANCNIIIKDKYTECGHTIEVSQKINEELINKTEEELKVWYPDYEIEEFTSSKIILSKSIIGKCDNHYIIKAENELLSVYNIVDNQEILYEKTDISTFYLTETDKLKIEKGIEVYGKDELRKFLEDYS